MFNHLTIRSRLIFVIGFLSLLLVTGGVVGLSSLSAANGALNRNYVDGIVPLRDLGEVSAMLSDSELELAQSLARAPADLPRGAEAAEQRLAGLRKSWSAFMAGTLSAEEKALADKFSASLTQLMNDGITPALTALRAQDAAAATTLVRDRMHPLALAAREHLQALMQLQLSISHQEFERSEQIYYWVRASCIAGIAFGVVLGALICAWLLRAIARPLADAVRVAKSVAAGDLTQVIEVRSTDETGQLLQSLKDMNDSLVRIVGEVRKGTDAIATASGQIASGNMDLSTRTEQQAAALEKTASSMEEITATVRQNADSALQANTLALSASEVARKGGDVVTQVVGTMGSINESSRRIVDIIGVIDSIAFQTNILALNAAVEAARAGEQGKGFAVVASEVRQLAQRSAAAAKEIKQLISDSVDKVDAGAKQADQAGATMIDIVASVRRVTDIMSEITNASQEQTAGISQINNAVSEMDAVTQQNAALVEQSAAAAASLQEQAVSLANVVSVFKLAGHERGVAVANTAQRADRAEPARPTLPAAPARAALPAGDDWTEF